MASSLPFEFNNASISSWLAQLNTSDAVLSGQEIFKALRVLKKNVDDIEYSSLELVVERLTPIVVYTCGYLEKFFYDKAVNHNLQQYKVAQLSVFLSRYIAYFHVQLALLSTEQANKALHANYAVQLIGNALYHSALSYDRPSTSLWLMLGEIYQIALDNHLLELTVNKPLPFFKKISIEGILKRNILFKISNCYKFNHKEIKQYFDFCTSNYHLVKFNQVNNENNQGYCWEYTSGQAPFFVTEKINIHKGSLLETVAAGQVTPKLAFDIEPLLNAIKYSNVKLPINESLGLVEHLSNYQTVDKPDLSLPKQYVFLFGFKQIIEFVSKLSTPNPFTTFSYPGIEELNFSSLNLTPTHVKKPSPNKVTDADIWGEEVSKVETVELKYGAQKAYQTSVSGLLIVEWMKVETFFNGLILIYGKDKKPILAIVRRAETKSNKEGSQKGVIELLEGDVSIVEIINRPEKKGLFLKQNNGYEIILPADNRYTIGSVFTLNQGNVVLERVVEDSSFFVRYGVSYLNEG